MANKANLVIDQGADFSVTITLTDQYNNAIDLTNFTGTSQLRKTYSSINSMSFGVSLNAAGSAVTLTLNSASTSVISPGRYVYDVEIISPLGAYQRIIEGLVTVTPGVTKNAATPSYYTLTVANVQSAFYTNDIVFQSNGSANVSGKVYESNMLLTELANTVVLKIMSSNGDFIVSSNTSYKLYNANNSLANGSVLAVNKSIIQ